MPKKVRIISREDCMDSITSYAYGFPILGSDGYIYEYDTYCQLISDPKTSYSLISKHPIIVNRRVDGKTIEEVDYEADPLERRNFSLNDFIHYLKAHIADLKETPLSQWLTDTEKREIRKDVEIEYIDIADRNIAAADKIKRLAYSIAFHLAHSLDDALRIKHNRLNQACVIDKNVSADKKKDQASVSAIYVEPIEEDDLYLPRLGWAALDEFITHDDVEGVAMLIKYRRNYLELSPKISVETGLTQSLIERNNDCLSGAQHQDPLLLDSKTLIEKVRENRSFKIMAYLIQTYQKSCFIQEACQTGDYVLLDFMLKNKIYTAKEISIKLLEHYILYLTHHPEQKTVMCFFKRGYPVAEEIIVAGVVKDSLKPEKPNLPLKLTSRQKSIMTYGMLGKITLWIDNNLSHPEKPTSLHSVFDCSKTAAYDF